MNKMHTTILNEQFQVSIFFVKNVSNTSTVRSKAIAGELDCTVIKAALVLDPLQILIAAKKAFDSNSQGKLKTKSLNSEVLFNLSVSKKISQSFKVFGIDDSDKDIAVCVFEERTGSKAQDISSIIDGEHCKLEEVSQLADVKRIRQIYNIEDRELNVSTLLDSVVSRIAIKGFASF